MTIGRGGKGMKRGKFLVRVLAVGVLVEMLAFGLAGVGVAFQNEPEGFRGLKWGNPSQAI